jgi:phosphatidate cytidylyltransferase
MLRTRLWMGSLLILLAILLLLEDRWFAPWFPILLAVYFLASFLAGKEWLAILPEAIRPHKQVLLPLMGALAVANWWPAIRMHLTGFSGIDVWQVIGVVYVLGVIAAFLHEIAHYQGPGKIVERLATTIFGLSYLGILASFLAQLRWLDPVHSTTMLALAVFVPKCNDIGAYFTGKFLTGRLLGRTKMTPLLSPNKTWQGAAGGMLASMGIAMAIHSYAPLFSRGILEAAVFGFVVGVAGILGDLAESLIKRDLGAKDASKSVPGFGGVLDVIDSLLFAAPVVYLWFRMLGTATL